LPQAAEVSPIDFGSMVAPSRPVAGKQVARQKKKVHPLVWVAIGVPVAIIGVFIFWAVTMRANLGTRLTFNGGELFYTASVSEPEARRLGQFLVTEKFFDGEQKSVQITRVGSRYEFRMVIKTEFEQDQDYLGLCKELAGELSQGVFNGAQVDIHLCDSRLNTIRVITGNPSPSNVVARMPEPAKNRNTTPATPNRPAPDQITRSFVSNPPKPDIRIRKDAPQKPLVQKPAVSTRSQKPPPPEPEPIIEPPHSVPTKPPGKSPAPDEAAQQKALKAVADLYGERHKSATTTASKRTLVEDMLRRAEETDDQATRFVMLRVARDIAIKAGLFDLAAKTIVERDRGWIIDVIGEGRLVLEAAVKAAQTSADQITVAQMAVELQNRAVAAKDFNQAVEFGDISIKAARPSGNSQLVKAVVARNKEVKALQEGGNTAPEPEKTTDTESPTSPTATPKPEIGPSPGFQVVWKGNNNEFIEARNQLTPMSLVLELKAHNLSRQAQNGLPSADAALDQATQQIVNQLRKDVPQYRGKAIREKKRNDQVSGSVLTRTIEYGIGR
jgi:hypothetical protein